MKLKYDFETVEMGDEIIMVPIGKSAEKIHGIIKLNKEGQEIVNLLLCNTNENEIVHQLIKKYSEEKNLDKYVHEVIVTLRQNDLIED